MRRIIIATMVVMAMAGVRTAQAQVPVSLELRAGAAFPTADLGDAALNTGGGAGFLLSYRFMPHLGVYAGWDWMRLTTGTPFRGAHYDVENTGYAFGLKFEHPLGRNTGYWVRGGGLYGHIELEDANGNLAADSGHELGWEVGGGLVLPIGGRLAVTPGLRYRSLAVNLPADAGSTPVDLTYVTAELGFQFSFGVRRPAAALVR